MGQKQAKQTQESHKSPDSTTSMKHTSRSVTKSEDKSSSESASKTANTEDEHDFHKRTTSQNFVNKQMRWGNLDSGLLQKCQNVYLRQQQQRERNRLRDDHQLQEGGQVQSE